MNRHSGGDGTKGEKGPRALCHLESCTVRLPTVHLRVNVDAPSPDPGSDRRVVAQ